MCLLPCHHFRYFSFLSSKILREYAVDFHEIGTRIVRLKSELADHYPFLNLFLILATNVNLFLLPLTIRVHIGR